MTLFLTNAILIGEEHYYLLFEIVPNSVFEITICFFTLETPQKCENPLLFGQVLNNFYLSMEYHCKIVTVSLLFDFLPANF